MNDADGVFASFRAIFYKEIMHIRRERSLLFFTMFMPLMQMCVYGWLDTNVRHIPAVVCDESHSTESRKFIDELRATGSFDIVSYALSPSQARNAVISARAKVAFEIPADYHDRITRGDGARVLVLIDGSESTTAATALGAANGVAMTDSLQIVNARSAGRTGSTPIEARPVILFNPDSRSANYLIPGLIAILLSMVTSILTAVAIVRERERGTLEQLLVSPINPVGLMLGKVAPYLFVGLAEMTSILTAMRFIFQVPIHGSLLFLYAVSLIYIFALLAIGLFVSIGAQTQQGAQQSVQMLMLPSMFLSGYIFPLPSLPLPLRVLSQIFPATHMVEIMRGVVLRGAGPLQLWRPCAALTLISFLLIAMSVRRFKQMSL